jgi:hypothetical protein
MGGNMQRIVLLLTLMTLLCGGLFAQEISINCSPPQIFVNSLSSGSFDPVNPNNQPVLTSITISNLTQQAYMYDMNIAIKWNQTEIINATFHSINPLRHDQPVVFSNRELISRDARNYFTAPDGEISITNVMEQNPVLSSALQSGFFPDGTISFVMTVTPVSSAINTSVQGIPGTATFSIRIKNINSIFLTYPGKPCGQTPSDINMRPVTFLWNTVNTNANQYRLVVKEFVPNSLPNPGSVETGGNVVFDGVLQESMFAEFLPFQDKHYYAWQVSTSLYNESHYLIENKDNATHSAELKSEWYVFRYTADQNASSGTNEQIMAVLNLFNDPSLQSLFAQGYELTGVVIYEGQVYTGQEAIDLINSLLGKNLEIEIKER